MAATSCIASGLRVVLESALPALVDVTFTLQRGATIGALAGTSVACTVSSGSASCTSGASTAAISTGDLIVLQSLASATIGSDINVFFGWVCQ